MSSSWGNSWGSNWGTSWGFGTETVIATTNYSLHPVNCQMEGNAPSIKPGGFTVEWARGKAGTKVTVSTSGPRRLSKTAPSFTVRTKQGVLLD